MNAENIVDGQNHNQRRTAEDAQRLGYSKNSKNEETAVLRAHYAQKTCP